MTEPGEGSLVLLSSANELDTRAIDRVQSLLDEIERYRSQAMEFAKLHGNQVWDGNGSLTLEAIDFTDVLYDKIGLTFGVENRPDFTVTVEFLKGEPHLIWAAD